MNDEFFDALDYTPSDLYGVKCKPSQDEPLERVELPFLKDPKQKISMWSILKEAIGKDLTKMSMPVYFNEPGTILQKCCQIIAYDDIMEEVMKIEQSP